MLEGTTTMEITHATLCKALAYYLNSAVFAPAAAVEVTEVSEFGCGESARYALTLTAAPVQTVEVQVPEPSKLLLPLVLGGVYRRRNGEVVRLDKHYEGHTFAWIDGNGNSYTEQGSDIAYGQSSADLIERIA